MNGLPPGEAYAAEARAIVEEHRRWDAPHHFITLHWDGERIRHGTYAVITPDVDPADYPAYMAALAYQQIAGHTDDLPVGYLLQMEGNGIFEHGDETGEWRAQVARDRAAKTYHQRPDHFEVCDAWVAAVDGRLWNCRKYRQDVDEPALGGHVAAGRLLEAAYPAAGQRAEGVFINALASIAAATGALRRAGLPR